MKRQASAALAASLFLSTVLLPTHASAAIAESGVSAHTKVQSVDASENTITEERVQTAINALEKMSQQVVDKKLVPGLAVGVVYKDKLVYAKGFGVKEVGKSDPIDPDTVFQLASVSKPVASTVVAELVGEGKITWDSKISDLDPSFKMFDPWVTSQITLRDFFAHRSGLPDHAGDVLEDLGADRAQVLFSLRYQKPSSSFRSHYEYTNFGITEGAVAAGKRYGLTWEEASEQKLFRPLGMNSTSARYSDFIARANKAMGHTKENGQWVHKEQRQPDAQSPAGGVSSSVNDMAKWMRLQIGKGTFEGRQVVDEKALTETHHPHMLTQFNPFNGTPGFYGLGINVSYDERGRLRLNHSGAFSMGAATCVTMMPGENIGVIALTNGSPSGVPEALNASFMDFAQNGAQQHDWLAIFQKVFQNPATLGEVVGTDYSKVPESATPQATTSAYTGKYHSDFFGDLLVKDVDGKMVMFVGPKNMSANLKHYDRDTFTYQPVGENATGLSGVIFTMGPGAHASELLVEHLNESGEGTFKLVK
ncbi:MAG TPA: serine hydrolase domain-containing protein [Drouetiella sp.]|jgi:CubicO group peptidase (beta-lactamase class C family)